jgi:uncharacterized membrane protein
MQRLRKKSEERLGRAAANATRWIGSTKSLIVHTLLFIVSFSLYFFGFEFDKILLVVTTIVSLEAIYLSIFIQISVNNQAKHLDEVAEDLGEIQEDVEGIEKDIDEIQEDVEEIQEDVDEIQEDVGEVDELDQKRDEAMLSKIEGTLQMLIGEINALKKQQEDKNK